MSASAVGQLALLALALLTACGARSDLPRPEGDDAESGGGATSEPGRSRRSFELRGTIRDFSDAHPDFESGALAEDPGIVDARLGDDGLPVYAGDPDTPTTHGKEAFDQWFRDVPGVNEATPWSETLKGSFGAITFSDLDFFPINDELFGNEGRGHNFHFTLEAHAELEARGGELLRFEGDDNLWVLIDGRLVLDLGGVHATQAGTVALDDLDLAPGERYALDLFFAERQTSGSRFTLSLSGFALCDE